MRRAFQDERYTVVTFDASNSYGESEGRYEDATITQHLADLEDVTKWAEKQGWYQAPFVLAGHSLGGFANLLYAEKNPKLVSALAPTGTVVTGKLLFDARFQNFPEDMFKWMETGCHVTESVSQPGVMKRLPWSHMVDSMRYDTLQEINKLRGKPMLLLVGAGDDVCLPEHQELLFNAHDGPKELHVIPGCAHTPRESPHVEQVYRITKAWASRLEE